MEFDDAAGVLGTGSGQMITTVLVLGFITIPEWQQLLKDELAVIDMAIRRRTTTLKGEL